MSRPSTLLGSALLITLSGSRALAQTPPPLPPPSSPPSTPPPPVAATPAAPAGITAPPAPATPDAELPPGVRSHDGFYLRASTGFVAYSELIGRKGSDDRLTVTGMGTMGDIEVGGTVGRNVWGGGIWGATILASTVTSSNAAALTAYPSDRPALTMIGPFLDHYFEGALGAHFQVGLGFTAARGPHFDSYSTDTSNTAIGGGFTLAFGRDWWVGDQWSVGVLARMMAAAVTEQHDGQRYYHLISATPGALFTVVYH